MQKSKLQMSLIDTYNDVCLNREENKPEFLVLLEEHIDFGRLIIAEFCCAFYRHIGRPLEHTLESLMKFCVLQKVIGIEEDSTLFTVLRMSSDLREFCGFKDVPDGSKMSLMVRRSRGSCRALLLTSKRCSRTW